MREYEVWAVDSHPADSRFRVIERERDNAHDHREDSQGERGWAVGTAPQKNFPVEAIGHDIRSTQYAKNGHADPLCSTDYKEPPIVCYENLSR